jgi:hypothetical protein
LVDKGLNSNLLHNNLLNNNLLNNNSISDKLTGNSLINNNLLNNSIIQYKLIEQFDYIVGNPPWLSYRYVASSEYQVTIKRLAVDCYAIAPSKQKLFPQMELATIFLVHTLTVLGKPGARLAFVMPRSVLTADQHEKLRAGTHKAPVTLTELWDLDKVKPIFNVPCCVLLADKWSQANTEENRLNQPTAIPTIEWSGKLPNREVDTIQAAKLLQLQNKLAHLVTLGARNALSTNALSTQPQVDASVARQSDYWAKFHQGATIVPRNCYFVTIKGLSQNSNTKFLESMQFIEPDQCYVVETDQTQAKGSKPPYHNIFLQGQMTGRFIFLTALSKHLLPFKLLAPTTVVLPVITIDDGQLKVSSATTLKDLGYPEVADWMAQVEACWVDKRKDKATRQTVYEWLNYHNKLTNQALTANFLVLYNAAGTNLVAVVVERDSLRAPFIVESKLYWCSCNNRAEADYLAAVLNSNLVNQQIKPFQTKGLLGERDIHKKPLELPIPQFDMDSSINNWPS